MKIVIGIAISMVAWWLVVTVKEVLGLYRVSEVDKIKIDRDKALGLIEKHIMKLDGYGFEDFMEYVFDHAGYDVVKTKRSCDGGKDLILNCEIYVELKRYNKTSRVGGEIVKKLYATCVADNISEAILINTNVYTKDAIALINKYKTVGVNIEKWYIDDVINFIDRNVNIPLLLSHIGYTRAYLERYIPLVV